MLGNSLHLLNIYTTGHTEVKIITTLTMQITL